MPFLPSPPQCWEVTSSRTEQKFWPVSPTCARWPHALLAPVCFCSTSCLKIQEDGQLCPSTLHIRDRGGKPRDRNIITEHAGSQPGARTSSLCLGQDAIGFNHSQVPLVPLRFIPEDALQNKWMVENLLPPPLSLLKSSQLAMLGSQELQNTHYEC